MVPSDIVHPPMSPFTDGRRKGGGREIERYFVINTPYNFFEKEFGRLLFEVGHYSKTGGNSPKKYSLFS